MVTGCVRKRKTLDLVVEAGGRDSRRVESEGVAGDYIMRDRVDQDRASAVYLEANLDWG